MFQSKLEGTFAASLSAQDNVLTWKIVKVYLGEVKNRLIMTLLLQRMRGRGCRILKSKSLYTYIVAQSYKTRIKPLPLVCDGCIVLIMCDPLERSSHPTVSIHQHYKVLALNPSSLISPDLSTKLTCCTCKKHTIKDQHGDKKNVPLCLFGTCF